MEAKAIAKYVRVQPRKVRIVAAEVKGKSAIAVANTLQFHPSKGAYYLRKVVVSAIANAETNLGLPGNTLKIARIQVDEGPKLKRVTQKAMGRGARIVKKT
ncbi:MAG: 50S ribosomal protein L22, partial [Anaerolineae bacterium]|nr:50S ribosomal protein L22 [Anaerolineae bacterium]